MISFSEAMESVCTAIDSPGPAESISLYEASGRILRTSIHAEQDAPPFDRVMMDGYALQASAWTPGKSFRIQACIPAGQTPPDLSDSDSVIEVMTGGSLPVGCDVVVPVEWCDARDGQVYINPPVSASVQPGGAVHAKGSDGEAGRTVLSVGQRLGPAELAVAATEGAVSLGVTALPRIHLLTTGDEVVPPEQTPGPGQIRGSHAVALSAMIHAHTGARIHHRHVVDEMSELNKAIQEALSQCDVLLLAGGVSKGRWDYVPDLLSESGVTIHFHGVAQKPGRPLLFGKKGGVSVFGLPGNPNSALVCARMYVLPALDRWCGAVSLPPLRGEIADLPPRLKTLTHFLPLRRDVGGLWRAVSPATSGSLHALCNTHALAECPPDPDQPVLIHPWNLKL